MRPTRIARGSWIGPPFESYSTATARRLAEIDSLVPPERLRELRSLVRDAIAGQRAFFASWEHAAREGAAFESQLTSETGFHAGLHRSHRLLIQAYERMLRLFPDEHAHNRKAFYEHLCSLDLI